jgi:hypothetical protein
MRMLMIASLPHEPFNSMAKEGIAGNRMEAIIADAKPESVNFTEMKGRRTAIMIVDVEKPSMIPSFTEPWFITFNADVEFHVIMNPEDLHEAGLDKLGKKWG